MHYLLETPTAKDFSIHQGNRILGCSQKLPDLSGKNNSLMVARTGFCVRYWMFSHVPPLTHAAMGMNSSVRDQNSASS